jgi:hypothetical protein
MSIIRLGHFMQALPCLLNTPLEEVLASFKGFVEENPDECARHMLAYGLKETLYELLNEQRRFPSLTDEVINEIHFAILKRLCKIYPDQPAC